MPPPASVIAIRDNRRMRPFSFIADASDIADGRDLAERARRAESMGVTTFAIPDHLVAGLFSPAPYLATVAAATTTLRIGRPARPARRDGRVSSTTEA